MRAKEFNYQLLIRRIFLVLLDIICIVLASFFALATRFEFIIYNIPKEFLEELIKFSPLFVVSTIIVFSLFKIYNSLWEYAGLEEVFSIVWACVVSGVLQLGIIIIGGGFLPRSYYLLTTIYLGIFVCGTRFSYRLIRLKNSIGRCRGRDSAMS